MKILAHPFFLVELVPGEDYSSNSIVSSLSFFSSFFPPFMKKFDNLHYNILVCWADGTNDSLTKRLTFQVFFLIDLGHSKLFIFISVIFLENIKE